jgi:mono/diheme cytochrome c family protein
MQDTPVLPCRSSARVRWSSRHLVMLLAFAWTPTLTQAQDAAAVERLLAAKCVLCHQGESPPGGLRLDSIDGVLKGSARGPVVKPGDPAASEIVRRIRGQSQPRMPLTGPPFLSDAEVTVVESWIAAGAQRPAAGSAPATSVARPRDPTAPVTYADVQPILGARCAKCHTDNGLMGAPPEGYRLNNYANTIAATDRVRIVPGQPDASELLRRIRGLSQPRMPFDSPPWLDDAQTKLIEAWIAGGARDADGKPMPVPAGARVRLRGVLTAPDAVDGARFTGNARQDRRVEVGSTVELEARVGADGRLVAERLRRR